MGVYVYGWVCRGSRKVGNWKESTDGDSGDVGRFLTRISRSIAKKSRTERSRDRDQKHEDPEQRDGPPGFVRIKVPQRETRAEKVHQQTRVAAAQAGAVGAAAANQAGAASPTQRDRAEADTM
jgi:hypothetical protein